MNSITWRLCVVVVQLYLGENGQQKCKVYIVCSYWAKTSHVAVFIFISVSLLFLLRLSSNMKHIKWDSTLICSCCCRLTFLYCVYLNNKFSPDVGFSVSESGSYPMSTDLDYSLLEIGVKPVGEMAELGYSRQTRARHVSCKVLGPHRWGLKGLFIVYILQNTTWY